ncbi:MAG: ABC transporter ATP-binding protein [Vicinamibacterales bacterium]
MPHVIETAGLSLRYGRTEAVRNLTMEVPAGSVYALIGPNGAGKTTTIKALMNLLRPSSGRASVLSIDSRQLGPAALQRIGYVSENQELPLWMTAADLMAYCAPFYPSWDRAFAASLAKQLALPIDKPLKACSRGTKMKAALVASLAYHPELLVLDEPFAGLDALVREEFTQGILEVAGGDRPWTVFISSHDIDEVERLADWIGVINEGRLELAEPVSSLLARFRRIEVATEGDAILPSPLPASWLLAESSGRSVRFVENRFVESECGACVRDAIPGAHDISVTPMSLREIFIVLARVFRLAESRGGER